MTVTGNEGGSISNADAQSWISSFQNTYPNETWSYLFGMNIVNSVKGQTGTLALRFYNGLDTSSVKKIVIFAVNSAGDGLNGHIADHGVPCPPSSNCSMSCAGDEGSEITTTEAGSLISNFKTTYPNEIFSNMFGINILNNVFNLSGIAGIRVYNSLNTSGVKKMIIYGVDSSGANLTGYIAEYGVLCPPNCGKP